jgi:hypothetical protein
MGLVVEESHAKSVGIKKLKRCSMKNIKRVVNNDNVCFEHFVVTKDPDGMFRVYENNGKDQIATCDAIVSTKSMVSATRIVEVLEACCFALLHCKHIAQNIAKMLKNFLEPKMLDI